MRLHRHLPLFIFIVLVAGAAFTVGVYYRDASPALSEKNYGGLTSVAEEAETGSKEGVRESQSGDLVVRVIDGDTVELFSGERVRLIGIDAPERGGCYFEESKVALEQLVSRRAVRLERDITERDRYGRLLAYIYSGATFVNAALVHQGAATDYPYPPDTLHAALFAQAEARARAENRGIWAACDGSVEPSSVSGAPDGCVVKGNISSSGEKIYHLPGCGSYERTRIDEKKGERWFCGEEEALTASWRKAKNCP